MAPNLDKLNGGDLLKEENRQLRASYAELHRGLVDLTERNVMLTQMLCATVYKLCGNASPDAGGFVRVTPELLDDVRDHCGFRLRTTYTVREDKNREVELSLEPMTAEQSKALKEAIGAMAAVTKLAKEAARGTTDEKPPRLDGSDAQN